MNTCSACGNRSVADALKSIAPAKFNEEALNQTLDPDLYNREIDECSVEANALPQSPRNFMKMIIRPMPKRESFNSETCRCSSLYQVESYLSACSIPTV